MQSGTKEYHRQKSKEYYTRNVDVYKERNRLRREQSGLYLKEVKSGGCIKCGEREHLCLDLHHLDPSQKDFEFGGTRTYTVEKLKIEVAKCVVVCRNCHAKLHAGIITL